MLAVQVQRLRNVFHASRKAVDASLGRAMRACVAEGASLGSIGGIEITVQGFGCGKGCRHSSCPREGRISVGRMSGRARDKLCSYTLGLALALSAQAAGA